MRFLLRFRHVARMTGVDATRRCCELGTTARDGGRADRPHGRSSMADVCASGLPAGQFDFVWGEDAWCYVEDKAELDRRGGAPPQSRGRDRFHRLDGRPSS